MCEIFITTELTLTWRGWTSESRNFWLLQRKVYLGGQAFFFHKCSILPGGFKFFFCSYRSTLISCFRISPCKI